jgi:hypothetical protein
MRKHIKFIQSLLSLGRITKVNDVQYTNPLLYAGILSVTYLLRRSSINDVTQFGTNFDPLPPLLHIFMTHALVQQENFEFKVVIV